MDSNKKALEAIVAKIVKWQDTEAAITEAEKDLARLKKRSAGLGREIAEALGGQDIVRFRWGVGFIEIQEEWWEYNAPIQFMQLANLADIVDNEALIPLDNLSEPWAVGDRVTFTQAGLKACDPAISEAEVNGTVIEVIDSETVRVKFDNGEIEKWAACALTPGTPNPDAIDEALEAEEIEQI